jgi:hypothetical protein
MIEADIARVYAERGYLVLATPLPRMIGELRDQHGSAFDPGHGHVGQPYRIISETDEADMEEQLRIAGVPVAKWGQHRNGNRYYRVESD